MSIAELKKNAQFFVDDPMWANHAEVPKQLLRKMLDAIEALEAENKQLQEAYDRACRRLAEYLELYTIEKVSNGNLAHALELSGVRLGCCEYCGIKFPVGRLTGRRTTAKYCKAAHRAAAQRQRAKALASKEQT